MGDGNTDPVESVEAEDEPGSDGNAKRRRFLQGLGAIGATSIAGCVNEDVVPTIGPGETATPTATPQEANNAILLVTVTKGFRHASIPTGTDTIQSLVDEIEDERGVDMTVDVVDENLEWSENSETSYPDEIQSQLPSSVEEFHEYDCVVFLSTTGEIFEPEEQQPAFKEYIQTGGGWMGIHAGNDTHEEWPWFEDLAGAWFDGHPFGEDGQLQIQEAEIHVTDRTHPATEHLPARWVREDEWYDHTRNPRGNTHVLATLDERTYEGANMDGGFGRDHPNAWCQNVGQGRSFYTAGGHTEASFSEPDFQQHLKGGLMWAAGYADGDATGTVWDEYDVETIVSTSTIGTEEPMKLDIADDGRVFITDRGAPMEDGGESAGKVFVYHPETGQLETVAEIPVYTGQEDGLQGIALDPDFADNGYIYLYHSPPEANLPDDLDSRLGDNHLGSDMGVNRLSRFTFENGSLNLDSQVQILDVIVQRNTCCHTGGALDFDSQGNLYLSTGDDTNPFESSGYTPIDERDGREPWDAQRSSANSADLRGSVLRISPNDDGSYDIPDGNMIDAVGATEDEVRPEIYAMGFRNPFTLQVDPATDVPYVGDYGPDAGSWDAERGPPGQTEYVAVDEPGFYGWPYFTGHNIPYVDGTFETQQNADGEDERVFNSSGNIFDPENPVNDSVNNTGLQELPPAQGATIASPYSWDSLLNNPTEFDQYMPYGSVDEVPFPQVTGGAPAMGPIVPDRDEYGPDALPSSYDNKIFMMEWGANWLKYATLDDNGEIMEVDPFLPDIDLRSPQDMALGPDGALYVLEWGNGFFSVTDSRITRISASSD